MPSRKPARLLLRDKPNGNGHSDSSAENDFPIVGIGASAGGLEAFTQLLGELPLDTGCGFVLVQHLDPQHESALTELLARTTKMPVHEVTNDLRVRPNHVYIIPPNTTLGIANGVLTLEPRPKTASPHRSIDHFFGSLARDRHNRAIGVILSGNANDGTLGLEAIRAEGGLTFAQDASARHDSMPRSAIAAGCVDFVLSPRAIATELARIARHPVVLGGTAIALAWLIEPPAERRRPPVVVHHQPARASRAAPVAEREDQAGFEAVLDLLRKHCHVDFSLYKPPTIQRRIMRRMVLTGHDTLARYAQFLRDQPAEFEHLFADVLINVTEFFREPAAFEVLVRDIFPALLAVDSVEPVRIWSLGCSTGQEAYSLAMAFAEAADRGPRSRRLQVFATDVNEPMLVKARQGFYPRGLVQNVSPERLRRFFSEEEGGYRVIKPLREQIVFARQNLISDPPFSHLDLISCRNVLIYLDTDLQRRAIPTFHYALNPGGFLMLGSAESIGPFGNLFTAAHPTHRIFAMTAGPAGFHLPVPDERDTRRAGRQAKPSTLLPVLPPARADLRGEIDAQREADRVTVRQFAPPAVLVDAERRILQFRGGAGAYLKPAPGKASFDVLKMARDGLAQPLRSALDEAARHDQPVRRENVPMTDEGGTRKIHLEVVPLKNLRARCFLVFFSEATLSTRPPGLPRSSRRSKPHPPETGERLAGIENELNETRAYLQAVQEQQETVHEELQASNEEAQSANEELQSLNEELETSKEELQSTNEELTTVNDEMAHRNSELSVLNSDLTNLQVSINLAVVLLGPDLTVRRFSAKAEQQLGLRATDLGRPLAAVRHTLVFPDLEQFIASAIGHGAEGSRDVRDTGGRWHSVRVRPYLAAQGVADGAVLAVVDIDDLKRTERRIEEEREHAEAIVRTVPNPILLLTSDLRLQFANDAFYRAFQLTPEATKGRPIFDLDERAWNIPRLRHLLEEIIPRNSFFNELEVTHEFPRIGRRTLLFDARVLNERGEHPKEILLGIQDVTEVLAFQIGLRRSELRYRRLFEASKDGVLLVDAASRKIVDANPFMTALLGYSHEELCGRELFEIGLLADRDASEMAFRRLQAEGAIRYENLPLRTKSGERREVEFVSNLYQEFEDPIIQCNVRDITERKRTARRLAEKARLLDLTNDAIIVRDLGDNITLWNKGAEKLLGWPSADAIGQHLHTLLQTEFPRPMPEIVAQLEREGHFSGEVTQIARDGRRIPSLCRWVLDRDTDSILTTYTDLTQFHQLQSTIRSSEERYRTLFNSIDEGFCIVEVLFDENGRPDDYRFVETNPSFAKHSGLLDVVGKRMREIAADHEEHWFATYGKVAQTGEPVRFEAEAQKLQRWFDVHAFRLGGAESRRVAVLFTDITQRKASEASLLSAQERLANRAGQLEALINERTTELTSTNKQLEAFVYSIAHDLRAPLRSMQVFSAMLLDETRELSEDAKDYARRVNRAAGFLDALLRDLLAFSRVNQQRVEFAPVRLDDVVSSVLSFLSPEIERTQARIDRAGAWPVVLAHEPSLTQILLNLLGNALKFVRAGETPKIRLWAEERGAKVRVWIEDEGIGIAAEYREQVFRLFNRLNRDAFPGTGVGLAIVQKALQRMGGQMGIESAPIHGCRFWFELPATALPALLTNNPPSTESPSLP